MNRRPPQISAYGDHAIYIKYDTDEFDTAINDVVHDLAARFKPDNHWIDVMTGYDSLVLTFDNRQLSFETAKHKAENAIRRQSGFAPPKTPSPKTPSPKTPSLKEHGRLIDIPVHYGGEYGPDLAAICRSSGLSEQAVIEKHSAQIYRVCMMGFLPGFAFLSEIPKALHHPRRATPRARVPAGSIGIANWQTGIYGLDSPGGWQIIGRTDLTLFDKTRTPPSLIETGNQIRFIAQ